MTFQDFLNTRKEFTDIESGCEHIGMEPEFFPNVQKIIVFDGSFISQLDSGEFWIIIGRDEWSVKTEEQAARILYLEHHAMECVDRDSWDMESLFDLWSCFLTEFGDKFGLDKESDAQEAMLILCEEHPTQRNSQTVAAIQWVECFIAIWNENIA